MGAEKGSAFLLKVGNGAQPPVYAAVAGMRTTQMSVNGEPVVQTSAESWRHRAHAQLTAKALFFVAPAAGMAAWDRSAGVQRRFDGSLWSDGAVAGSRLEVNGQKVVGERQPAVPSPSGGTIIDAEARAAIASLIEALVQHGLID